MQALPPAVGPYNLTRELAAGILGPRWLCLHAQDQTSHVLQRFDGLDPHTDDRRFGEALARAAALRHRHLLPIGEFGSDAAFGCWAVTPFTGDQDGILSLERLLRLKGGSMDPPESRRAMEHLLSGVRAGHEAGLVHGPVGLNGIAVSRGGIAQIEFYSVAELLRPSRKARDELVREEVRSIARIGYQLITGLRVEEPLIPACRVVEGLDPSWDDWFSTGLGIPGFTTAAHALHALATCRLNFEIPAGRRIPRGFGPGNAGAS